MSDQMPMEAQSPCRAPVFVFDSSEVIITLNERVTAVPSESPLFSLVSNSVEAKCSTYSELGQH